MITTRMTAQEILSEYQADYKEFFRPILERLCSRKLHDLKKSRDKWICLREPLTIKSTRGNKYRSIISLRYQKKLGAGWKSVTFLETSDSMSGKKVALLFSDTLPILLTSGFLKELGIGIPEFLGHGCSWDIQTDDTREEERYSAWMDLGDSRAGVGGWKDGILVLRHIVPLSESPVSDFLASREVPEENKFEEEETPKSDIDLAWEAYLRGEL